MNSWRPSKSNLIFKIKLNLAVFMASCVNKIKMQEESISVKMDSTEKPTSRTSVKTNADI